MSDDFSDSTKKNIGGRVGWLCSSPACRAPTSGPQDDPAKAVNLGVAAHITAASPGGPRYDPSLSPKQRSAALNGVWLCQICAKLIDSDVARYSVEVLRKWKTDAESEAKASMGRVTASSISDFFMDVSVLNQETSSWNRGESTILRYTLNREEKLLKIDSDLGYLGLFKQGGPIGPLEYVNSPTYCPFKWDFPILDFKVLNNRLNSLFLTEIVFDIEESRTDPTPLLTIKKDTQQRYAGELQLVNEGGCAVTDTTISFQLLPEAISAPSDILPPYPHSISVGFLDDHVQVDVTDAFRKEGVNIDGLIYLSNGEWNGDVFVAPTADGSKESMTGAELEARWKKYLGRFTTEVGTLVGEINFVGSLDTSPKAVKFSAPVYLANKNRLGIPRPPSYKYDTAFEIRGSNYQRRVPISHSLEQGEADRFTVRVAIAQSSSHRFRASLRDVSGQVWESFPINMNCFVPRSRRKAIGVISTASTQ